MVLTTSLAVMLKNIKWLEHLQSEDPKPFTMPSATFDNVTAKSCSTLKQGITIIVSM